MLQVVNLSTKITKIKCQLKVTINNTNLSKILDINFIHCLHLLLILGFEL